MIDPGSLRSILVYERPESARDSRGQSIKTWVAVATIQANVNPLAGREGYWAKQVNAEVTHEVTLRYRPWLDPTGRFRFVGTNRVLNIKGVINVEERGVWAVASCVEAVPGS